MTSRFFKRETLLEVAPLPRLSRNGVENLHISSLHFFFHTFVKWYIMPGVLCLLGRTRVVCLASLRPRASSFSSWLWDPSPDNPAVQIKDFLLHCNGGTPPQTFLQSEELRLLLAKLRFLLGTLSSIYQRVGRLSGPQVPGQPGLDRLSGLQIPGQPELDHL